MWQQKATLAEETVRALEASPHDAAMSARLGANRMLGIDARALKTRCGGVFGIDFQVIQGPDGRWYGWACYPGMGVPYSMWWSAEGRLYGQTTDGLLDLIFMA